MKTLTIRGVPDDVHERLKEQAKRNRRSLNQEVIAELAGSLDAFGDADEVRKRRRAEELIGMVDDFRRGAKTFMTAEEIDAAIEEGRA